MTELFERDCPYYLSIGMTYDQYWYGDPLMVRTFYKAHKLKEQLADQQAWLQGQYVMAAIGATLGNMLSDEKSDPIEYPEEPYLLTEERQRSEVRRIAQEEREKAFAQAYMLQMVQAGKNWGKKEDAVNAELPN